MTPQELDCNDTESCQNSHSQHDESQNQSPNRDIVAVSGLSKVRAGRFDGHFNHLRYVIIMLSGLATGMMLFMRVSLSVAIISMVNRTALWQNLNVTLTESPDGYVEMGEFVWTNEIQQIILAGYMAAYALPQYFTLRWTMNYGIRISIPVALSTCALSVVLTPIAAYWGWEWVLALRLLNGLGASPMFPSMINTVESWTSKSEKTLGLAIAQFSCNIIHATTPLLTGYLASTHWKWSFYMPGAVALVFCVLWYVLVADHPAASSLISRKELEHLVGDGSDANGAGAEDKLKASAQLPWYFMFKLPAFYPILIMMILFDCTSGGFLFLMPQYLRRIMEIPVEQIGIINFIVQIGSMFCMLWSGPASALFQRMFNVSLTTARKMVTCICRCSYDCEGGRERKRKRERSHTCISDTLLTDHSYSNAQVRAQQSQHMPTWAMRMTIS